MPGQGLHLTCFVNLGVSCMAHYPWLPFMLILKGAVVPGGHEVNPQDH